MGAIRFGRAGAVGLLLVVAALGGGCGGEDRVERKQEAVAEARAELSDQIAAFCRSSADYIRALDRYGDLLTATEPTIGDVREAGADLADPRAAVVTGVQEVREARERVASAEGELADLTAGPSVSPEPTATLSAESVARVQQAEADLAAAQEGIDAKTPVDEASEQFNAAAVALEMAWIWLFDEAGCLSGDRYEQARAAARDYTLAVQKSLAEAGYYRNEIDGVYGPTTVEAVSAVQKKHDLPVTGTVDKATDAALKADLAAKGGAAAQQEVATAAAVQQTLKLAGYWPGAVDGTWTPSLTEALKAFQKELGVEPSGTVDAATIAAVERVAAGSASPAPTEPRPSE